MLSPFLPYTPRTNFPFPLHESSSPASICPNHYPGPPTLPHHPIFPTRFLLLFSCRPSFGLFRECHQVANTPGTMAIPDACASLVLAFAALDRPLPLPPRAFPFGGPVMNVGPTLLDMYHNKDRTTPRGRTEKGDFVSPLACGRSVSPHMLKGAGSADRQTQGSPAVGSQATLLYLPPKSQCDDLSPKL